MSVIDTFKSEFRFSVKGRTSRRNFWIYTIGTWLVYFAIATLAGLIYTATNSEDLALGIVMVGVLGMMILNIAYLFVTIRRLHDMGLSGWWFLAVVATLLMVSMFNKIAPGASLVVLIAVYVCLSKGSDVVPNRYD